MNIFKELNFGSLSSYAYGVDAYDSTKLGLGGIITQRTGINKSDNYVSPPNIGFGSPLETSIGIPSLFSSAITWTSNKDYVFYADGAAAAATRRVQLFELNRTTFDFTLLGFITLTFPQAGNNTIKGIKTIYDTYTTGTASVNGTAVTGTSSLWTDSRLAVGSRIGFGSKTPSAITTWYEISAIGSNTGITLTTDAGVIADGDYVIEELRIAIAVTNNTVANGGLMIVKGLRFELFNMTGTTISAATNLDNIRAVYWLKNAAVNTNTVSLGLDVIKNSLTSQDCYVLNTVANPIMFKYNLRAALTVVSGASENAFVLLSGAHGAVTGTPTQNGNFIIATASHGNGSGIPCGYFTTSTRVYRTIDVRNITSASTLWAGDNCIEKAPFGATTFAATSTMNNIAYSASMDGFIIATGNRIYFTKYRTDGSNFDRILLSDNKQLNQYSAFPNLPRYVSFGTGAPFLISVNNCITYITSSTITAGTNYIYALPLCADVQYTSTSNNVAITPKITFNKVGDYNSVYVKSINYVGSDIALSIPSEQYYISFRTSGISDNSGVWNLLGNDLDLSNVGNVSNEIQFKVEWKIMGLTCIPSKIISLGVAYDDTSTDYHFQPSIKNSNVSNKIFSWRFSTAFGSTVPKMRIRLFNAVNNQLLYDDNSVTQSGTWAKSTNDGAVWGAYDSVDKANETTYIRFTPHELADNLKVLAVLTEF